MGRRFISQPGDAFRLGDFLLDGFADHKWTEFRGASAFVKRSGTKHIKGAMKAFVARGGVVRFTAGVDAGGTSEQGLRDLIDAVSNGPGIFVYGNGVSSTFHPKVYLFRNKEAAHLVIGSGNFTEGGLYTNYEANVLFKLDLSNHDDLVLFESVVASLDAWSTSVEGECFPLDDALLDRLTAAQKVPNEKAARAEEKSAREAAGEEVESIFSRRAVRAAPKVAAIVIHADGEESGDAENEAEAATLVVPHFDPVDPQGGHNTTFLMTLQRTDVGVGQTTKGAQRRSPEIFIPLIARDTDPDFWGWPNLFVPDPIWAGPFDKNGRGKMDRQNVMVRLGGANFPVTMWYNPDKKDLRLRSEHLRSAGGIGDIFYMQRADGAGGFSYYVEIVPLGTGRYNSLIPHCNTQVRNSQKLFGYL
jgi:HKD family nuclease